MPDFFYCLVGNCDNCVQGSICFELMRGIPAAFVAIVALIITAFITYKQYKVAKAKLNLDLFEKRLPIFESTWSFLSGNVIKAPNLHAHEFTNLIPKATFLFGADIKEYMEEVGHKNTEFWLLHTKTVSLYSEMSADESSKYLELHGWFINEANIGVKKVFGKYLDFSNWK